MQIRNLSLFAISALTALSLISTGCKKSNDSTDGSPVSANIGGTVVSTAPAYSAGIPYESNNYFDLFGYSIKGTDSTGLEVTLPADFTLNQKMNSINGVITLAYY